MAVSIARVFDGADFESGEPFFASDHPIVADPAERARLVAYLNDGVAILWTTSLETDRVTPARGVVVPLSFRTDGAWIWTDAVSYYLETYGLRPDPGLCGHIAAAGYRCPEVADSMAHHALDELYRSLGDGPDVGAMTRDAPAGGPPTSTAEAHETPAFVASGRGEVPPPIRLETADGTLNIASNLTSEEFRILARMRQEIAERDRDDLS